MIQKLWTDAGWDDYLYWQTQDKKTLKRVNLLIKDAELLTHSTQQGGLNISLGKFGKTKITFLEERN
ncbi:hypothetical protein FACS189464_1360 [Bacteroidia bacterium]|nr:hypothetical protein FACS189464_1360 [Bacteroidia bacterium]